MRELPVLESERLLLRPFSPADAADVQRLAGDFAVADTTASIPHPYEDGVAEAWIGKHQELWETGQALCLAITDGESGALRGAIGLMGFSVQHSHAEIGYWIGKPFWGQGYCTEALKVILRFGFVDLKLHRLFARCMKRNPASARVMEKAGMRFEGCLREHIRRWDKPEDLLFYGALKREWK